MNRNRCRTNACFLNPPCHQDQRNHRDPRPPAVDEMGEIGIIHQSIKCAVGGIDAIWIETVVHQWPCVGDISRVQSGNPRAEEQLDKQYRQDNARKAGDTRGLCRWIFRQFL